jgi:hypothetical protein
MLTGLVVALVVRGSYGPQASAVPPAPWRGVGGVIDVTAAPFSADPSGVQDATVALQGAIDWALQYRATIFVPLGVYRVTSTLHLTCYNRSNDAIVVGEVLGSRAANIAKLTTVSPVVYPLLSQSHSHARPIIYLPESTAGFGNASEPQYLVFFLRIPDRVGPNSNTVGHET